MLQVAYKNFSYLKVNKSEVNIQFQIDTKQEEGSSTLLQSL